MRRIRALTLAFVATTLFAACSSEDTESISEQTQKLPIAFDSYVGRSTTRGTIVDGTTIRTEGVGIFAMYTDGAKYGVGSYLAFSPNFMNNVKVENTNASASDDSWSYNPLRYWPSDADDYVSFLAYAPYQATAPTLYSKATDGTFTASGDATWIKYTVDAEPSKQVDLLRGRRNLANMQYYRDATGALKTSSDGNSAFTNSTSTTKVVDLTMIHACSRIAVVITAPGLLNKDNFKSTVMSGADEDEYNEGNASITVNKVVLLGDNRTAASETKTGAFTPSAYLCLAKNVKMQAGAYTVDGVADGFWQGQATDNKLAFTLDKSAFVNGTYSLYPGRPAAGGKYWTSTTTASNVLKAKKSLDSHGVAETSVNTIGTSSSNYMFVIPQDFSAGKDPLYCYIDYTVNYKDASTSLPNGVTYHAYGKIEQQMRAGGAYVIYIQIGNGSSSSLRPIEFHVNAEAWANETPVAVDE